MSTKTGNGGDDVQFTASNHVYNEHGEAMPA